MRDWMTAFSSVHESGLHLVEPGAAEAEIQAATSANGLDFLRVDVSSVSDKSGFLTAIASVLRFPSYFGMNWDALLDCLTDLSWFPAAGYVIHIDAFQTFADADRADAETALTILKEAAEFWKENEVPFHVILSAQRHHSEE